MSQPKKQGNEHRIPHFASLEEEAEFWDTHSPLDYPDEIVEDTEITVARPLGHILRVRLDGRAIDRLAAIARAQGLAGPSTLAAAWLLERLEETERQESKAD